LHEALDSIVSCSRDELLKAIQGKRRCRDEDVDGLDARISREWVSVCAFVLPRKLGGSESSRGLS